MEKSPKTSPALDFDVISKILTARTIARGGLLLVLLAIVMSFSLGSFAARKSWISKSVTPPGNGTAKAISGPVRHKLALTQTAEISWEATYRTAELKKGTSFSLNAGTTVSDIPADVKVVGDEFVCETGSIAIVPGSTMKEFDGLTTVPSSGYTQRETIKANSILFFQFYDGRYAKLFVRSVNAKASDLDLKNPNYISVSITYVRSANSSVIAQQVSENPGTSSKTEAGQTPASVEVLSGFNAVRTNAGFFTNTLPGNDDGSTGFITLPFAFNFFGNHYTGLFVNNNGNVTFNAPLDVFDPFGITESTGIPLIAPFFADVDTRPQTSGTAKYGTSTVNGHTAFAATWDNVGYFNQHVDKLNRFQLIIIDRSDTGPENFDIEFNYDQIQWETGDASGGSSGLGGTSAHAGFTNGSGLAGTNFEIAGSGVNGAFLDSNSNGLIFRINNPNNQRGRQVFAVRNGQTPRADLALAMMASPASVVVGANVTYTINVQNAGPQTATNVVVNDNLPSSLTLISATPSQGSCTGSNCNLGSIAVNGTASISLVARANVAGTISNTASVSATELDPNPANNSATVNVTATAVPVVTSINSTGGAEAGGTAVTITGSSFTSGTNTAVLFGTNSGTNVTVVNDTTITVTSPAGRGQVQVSVSNSSGAATNRPVFTYTPPPLANPQPAIIGAAEAGNSAIVFPRPDLNLPATTQNVVTGLPSNVVPHGVSYFGSDQALISDLGNSRVHVVRISTNSLLSTIGTPNYSGAGTIAVAPNLNAALANGGSATLNVIHAPFNSSANITTVTLPGAISTWQTQAIVFNTSGRAFVYHAAGISVLDPPYTSIAFTIPVTDNSSSGAIAITPDGNTLLTTNLSSGTVKIYTAPFSSSSMAVSLNIPGGSGLDGIQASPDGTKVLVVAAFLPRVWAISPPYNANSLVEQLPMAPGFIPNSGFEDVGISADGQFAILAGAGGSVTGPAAFIRAPFTAAGARSFAVNIQGGRGDGSVRFLPPGLAPGLTISKSAPATVNSGANLTYTITYGNTGTANATGVLIKDTVPAGTTFVSASNGGTFSAGIVTWNIGSVPAGTTGQTVSLTVNVTATPNSTITNSNYTIEGTGISPIPGPPVTTTVNAGVAISGHIMDGTNPIANATVTLSGSQSRTTSTDSTGFYTFGSIATGGNYTVTPSKTGYMFTPASQTFNNLTANQTANFTGSLLTFMISGRVSDASNNSLAGITVGLSGSATASATTDANGNYSFTGLGFGGNYTVTPTRTGFTFTPPSQTFSNLTANQTANFVGAPIILSISGRVTDGSNNALSNVRVTLSGGLTRAVQTDSSGNYSFNNLLGGSNYSVIAASPYYAFTPPRFDFTNLGSNQTANFVQVPNATPSPTPPLSDDFNAGQRDPQRWNLGTATQDQGAFDPQISVVQTNGQLVITPRANVSGPHYNGYVSVNAFDMRNGSASVEVVTAATGGADTIFAVSTDANNFFRFLVHTPGPSGQVTRARKPDGSEGPLDAMTPQLVFQVRIDGVLTSMSINYDSVQHRFMRFRQESANTIVFETSPNNVNFTVQNRVVLDKDVTAVTAELSAGTSNPTNPGEARFDNFSLVTSTFQFSASSYSVGEASGSLVITVTRGGDMANAATVNYATSDTSGLTACTVFNGKASERCDYETTVGTLRFAAGDLSKTITIPIVNDALVEGDETFTITLSGASLNAPALDTVTIVDNDSNPPPTQNPIEGVQFFVTQQYLDFLGRLPDQTGLANWMATLNGCPNGGYGENDHPECDRVHVSAGFFLSPEFQVRGYWAYKFYEVGFDRRPTYAEFVPDMALVGGPQSPESEALSKAAYTDAFALRSEFTSRYNGRSNTEYVNALEQNAEVTVANKDALIAALGSGQMTRGQVLRNIVESQPVDSRFFIRAFVAMQYFGYLRRDPDTTGYNNWVTTLTADPGNYRHMIFGFLYSIEYRSRFGP